MSTSNVSSYSTWWGSAGMYAKTVDDLCFGFGRSERLIRSSSKNHDSEGLLRGRVERAQAYATVTSYAFKGIKKAGEIGILLDTAPILREVSAVGFITNGLILLKSSHAAYKQLQFLSLLSKVDGNIPQMLNHLGNQFSIDALESRLVSQFVQKYGEEGVTPDLFKDLASAIQHSDSPRGHQAAIEKAQKLIQSMKWQAGKKLFVHALEIMGAIVGIAGTLAILCGMSHTAFILVLAGFAFQALRYTTANGWVTQVQGFSCKMLLPMFIRKRWSCSAQPRPIANRIHKQEPDDSYVIRHDPHAPQLRRRAVAVS